MADVNVSLGVTGKEVVVGAFQDVAGSAKAMGDALMEHTKKLAEAYLGYQSVVKVLDTFKQALDLGDKLADLSDQTGIAADRLVVMQRAFQNSGLEAEDLGKTVNKMQKFLEQASDASSTAAEKLGKLGLSGAYLKELGPEEQMRELAKAISAVGNPTERAADAMEIFGKSGGKTLALMKDFDQTMSEAEQQVGGLASVMGKNAGMFNEVNDALKSIKDKTVEFAVGILDKAMPALETLTTALKNIDATKFGQQFSETLVKGIDFVLGIFRDPGDLFLAFGDALVYTFKMAENVLISGLQYAIEWGMNYAGSVLSNYGELVKSTLTAAFGYVLGKFYGGLEELFGAVAGVLPEKFAAPLRDLSAKAAQVSEEWGNKSASGLAKAWEGISTAAEKATEETHFQLQDYKDAAGKLEQMRDHAEAVRLSGMEFRNQMAEANDHAKSTAEWLSKVPEIGREFANLMSGPEKTIQDMLNPNNGLGPQAGNPADGLAYQGTNAGDLAVNYKAKMAAAANMGTSTPAAAVSSTGAAPSIPSSFLGSNPYDQSVKLSQASGDYLNYLSAKQSQEAYNSARIEELNYQAGQARAAQDYTGNSQTSFADLFAQVQEKYRNMGYNYADSAALTDKELKDYIQKNPGPSAKDGGGGAGGGAAGPQKSPEATATEKVSKFCDDILKYLRDTVKLDQKLPLMALS